LNTICNDSGEGPKDAEAAVAAGACGNLAPPQQAANIVSSDAVRLDRSMKSQCWNGPERLIDINRLPFDKSRTNTMAA